MENEKVSVVNKLLDFINGKETPAEEVVTEEVTEETPAEGVTAEEVTEEKPAEGTTTEEAAATVTEEVVEEVDETSVPEKVEDTKVAFDKYEASKKLVAIGITDPEVMDNFISILEKDDKTEIIDLIGGLIKREPGKVVNVTEEVVKENRKPKRRV
jgi:hypothetical protein